jgi:aminomethyltransferase
VALGYVAVDHAAPGTVVQLMIRGRAHPGRIVELPFVPHRYRR